MDANGKNCFRSKVFKAGHASIVYCLMFGKSGKRKMTADVTEKPDYKFVENDKPHVNNAYSGLIISGP
jgi:hypothetical protein